MTELSTQEGESLSGGFLPELAKLINPVSVDDFISHYWEQEPLLVNRNDPSYYSDLLTLDGIDHVLSLAGVKLDAVRVVVEGKETPVSELGTGRGRNGGINSLETLYERYRNGSTIVVNSLQDRFEPLRRLATRLGGEMSTRLQMNIYLTPPGAQGFAAHYDTHDVFVAQVHGSKVWRLAGAPHDLPLASMPHDKSQPAPDPLQEIDLRSGDLLYLPRGTIHSATANETASLHVTIGIHPVLWAQAIEDAVAGVLAKDVRFRRALPIGFTHDEQACAGMEETLAELVDALHEQLSPRAMVGDALDRAVSISAPALRGHLLDLEELPGISLDTKVRRRNDLEWRLIIDETNVGLHFFNKAVQFPADVADEVRYATGQGTGWFTARSVPGELDEPGRMTLVQTLLREGFLTLR